MKKLLAIAIVFMFFMVAFIRLYGCATAPIIIPEAVTRVATCSFADGIDCLKCHDFRTVVAPWYSPDGKLNHFEIILPEGVDIDFSLMTHVRSVNPKSPVEDQVCRIVFSEFVKETGLWTIHVIFNKFSAWGSPPLPPLALVRVISADPSTKDVQSDRLFWIYNGKGMPEQVTEEEMDLYIESLSKTFPSA